jgi:branched-chain amino acid transport system ATP-binding protein
MTDDVLLETRALTKEFQGLVAVRNVNIRVRRGTIHALIGPNGAGKTTVFNLLTRFLVPTSGRIFYKGEDITSVHPALLARRGMARSFQISAVFPHLSVLENVRIALQRRLGISFQFWRSETSLDVLNVQSMEHLSALGLEAFADRIVSELPYGRKRALELATTLALDPEILLLDEPTSGLSHEDIARISNLIRLVAQGRSVLMIEHNLSVVARLSDIITVLQRGEILAEGSYDDVSRNDKVMEAYLGTGHAGM